MKIEASPTPAHIKWFVLGLMLILGYSVEGLL
jgi:hypothetical protein